MPNSDLSTLYVRYGKRAIDVIGAGALVVLAGPIMAFVAAMVRRKMGSPVLFRQHRVGRNGETFEIIKFRSMQHDRRIGMCNGYTGLERRCDHKCDHDPRHTPFGLFMRRHGLDELPQLFNVLRGDMSLVGPRPELVAVAERHNLADHPRHVIRPGLTGLWQVSDHRPGHLYENLHYDEQYLSEVSLATDLKVLTRTAKVVVKATGR